jgi:TorA maturation chaperone TorD
MRKYKEYMNGKLEGAMNHVIEETNRALEHKLGSVCLDRAYVYHLLAKAVQPPTLEFAESLLDGTFYSKVENSVQWVNEREGMYNQSLENLKKVSENKEGYVTEELFRKMKEEYEKLFLSADPNGISPFESDYGNKTKDSVAAAVLKAYNGERTDRMSETENAPDHISTELEFLSYLSRLEGEAWQQGQMLEAKEWRIKERTFMVHHLKKWGVSFFVKFERATRLEAYNSIAAIGSIFMTIENGN